ncbi:structural maintenance of chromosome complex subunit SmcA [Coniella lustricola]|uniref:Structural maintenance of chromosomes protein 5 n=1 Tax=Coniella lustricola TaxID=2025994 RepID=A0A2T3ADX7_9PEZI|nr:structural maintenance of chromosome complex subunit SmcA [Coniella lustricola]
MQGNSNSAVNGAPESEFAAGAIVRVMVENFVTYERAEFIPGPNLNMVIGPNGTGKSSLVCAICLGLGYPTSTLGRASSFGEFVKHGKDHAIVEIELQKRPQDRQNYVFRLKINREDNTRQFWLNGKQCRHTDIKTRMQTLRIQIDNLCQFLPQDRVAEFAGLNSIELLSRTLQAAAPEEVIQQQEQLKEMFDRQKESQRSLETEQETLRSLHTRQQGLQADVERLREREQIEQAIQDLQDGRLIIMYNNRKAHFDHLKAQKKKAVVQHRRLEELSAPSLEELNLKQEYKVKIDTALKARRSRATEIEKGVTKALQAVKDVQESIENLENERKAETDSLTSKRQALAAQRTRITQLEGQHKNGSDIETRYNPAEWNHKIRECQNRLENEFKERSRELETTKTELRRQGSRAQAERNAVDQEIRNLDSQEGQRLMHLKKISREVADAYDWLQQHKSEFEKEVFGPPMLSCSVKDKKYSDHIQMGLQRDDFLCFVAQTRADHKKLTQELFQKQNLAVSVRTILTDLSTFRPPLSQEALQGLGLDGYAIDYLEGPRPVLAMLCSEKKLHLTGVGLEELNDEQYQTIRHGAKINSFASGKTYYRINRRKEYGADATSTVTNSIRTANFWTDEPVDASGSKAQLQQKLRKLSEDVHELKAKVEAVHTDQIKLQQKEGEVQEELNKLESDKKEIQREYAKWKALPDKIEVETQRMQTMREDFEEARRNLSSYEDKFDQLTHKKVNLVLQHHEQLGDLREATQAVLEAHTRLIEATSDVASLQERNQGITERLEEQRQNVERLSKELDKFKAEARQSKFEVEAMLGAHNGGTPDTERRDYLLQLITDKTLESIDEDIEAESAKLDLIHDADPGVLRDFEKRTKDIERLQTELANRQANLQKLEDDIQTLRQSWEPGLDEIIRRINDAFSYNFEQINCAGEVGVHKDEDFDKWAIEIKVKFRENETLQKLDQHRQSGGERAVSTIFYLMSLQAMAQAPFRVVDEINQGMDPRNERLVHERMVEIACKEHTSQYFLITPKLLADLRYDERMKVMCIASGEYMPAEGGDLDFAKCIKIKQELMAAV